MSDFSADNKKRLLVLKKQETELFAQMRGITEKQAELIEADDLAAFNETLDSRQELIEKINGLHQESDALMQSYISYADSPEGEKIGELDAAIAELRGLVAEIAGMSEGIMEAAKTRAAHYTERIGTLSLSRKSLGKYQTDLPNSPQMFDKMT